MTTPTTRIRAAVMAMAVAGMLILGGWAAPTAAAAQAPFPPCLASVIPQPDMVGRYVGIDGPFELNVYLCGGSALTWQNDYGVIESAAYATTQVFPGGGYLAKLMPVPQFPGMAGPWRTTTVTYKPAARGEIQVIFYLPYAGDFKVYRAQKMPS